MRRRQSDRSKERQQEQSRDASISDTIQQLALSNNDNNERIVRQTQTAETDQLGNETVNKNSPLNIIPNNDGDGDGDDDDVDKQNNPNKNAEPNENAKDDQDDADSCSTLVDSGLSLYGAQHSNISNSSNNHNRNTPISRNRIDRGDIDDCCTTDEDNTISTSKMGSTNMDETDTHSYTSTNLTSATESQTIQNSSAESQTIQNSSMQRDEVVSLSSVSTLRSVGSAGAVSRGEEHITSRMKKYGLFNLNEMKRKQQQRRAIRNNNNNNSSNNTTTTTTAAASTKNNNPSLNPLSKNSNSIPRSLSVNSGLTEGMTESNNSNNQSLPQNSSDRFQQKNNPSNSKNNNKNYNNSNSRASAPGVPTKIRTAPLHVQMAVEEIHRWLFTEGGHFEDVQTLMTQYSLYVREHFGIPLDRLYYGGVGLHPKLTAYVWKWEAHGEFTHAEMPHHIFVRRNEIFSPDEPFCVLEQGRADHVRIRHTDDYIPPDTAKWFRSLNYTDYFALPDIHRGVSKGGLAWSTKSSDGFCDDDIQFFRMTHAALTTIMRLHTNDLVLNTLTDRMEAEITDRTNELAIANAKLEEANAEISKHASKQLEHFACMSHEIRTPLNCIVGLSSLLLENEDLSDNLDLMDTIHMVYNSADLVQGVVNDVLDYAKIESGHFELDIKPSDLQTTLNGVVHSISNKLVDKNVEVRTSYSGLLGKTMTTDSRRLQQILYNILGNAAKFSREGTTIDFKVTIVLDSTEITNAMNATNATNEEKQQEETPDDGETNTATIDFSDIPKHKIRFSIKDYGKGIEEKNFEKIFQPFSQASKETQTIYGGTGLGLSITKNLVARLGGSILIRSELNKFTEFIVDLPYNEPFVNVSEYKEKLSETTIVILDPNDDTNKKTAVNQTENENNNNDGIIIDETVREDKNDNFLPIPKSVQQQYCLSVLRCSSWGELQSKLGLRANISQNYFFLAHEDIEERQGILNVEKLVRRERCSWFTFGSDGIAASNRKNHFKSLTGVFPSTLLESLLELAAVQREASLAASNSSSANSSFSSLESKSVGGIMVEEPEGQEPRSVSPPNATTVSLSSTSSSEAPCEEGISSATKSKKRFATKYPPLALKVLIVDDNVINQKVLDRILKRLGVTDISIVNNGKKAVDITESTRFDCIFMDMEMPIMGGLQACKIIVDRDKEAARVVFVTAHDIEDIREKADEVGAFEYISKPLKMKDIHKFLTGLETLNPTEPKSFSDGVAVSAKKRPTPLKKKTRTKQYPSRNIKVLVAEDNLINQKVLDRILKRVGVTDITIVDNGKKAVDVSEETRFDCILMDMQMPIMDGLEACKIIVKRDKDKEDCPKIIFVTAHALVEFREKALAAGAFDFITKPFKMEDIDNVLKILEATKGRPCTPEIGDVISVISNTEIFMPSTSSDKSAMPKLVHSLGE